MGPRADTRLDVERRRVSSIPTTATPPLLRTFHVQGGRGQRVEVRHRLVDRQRAHGRLGVVDCPVLSEPLRGPLL